MAVLKPPPTICPVFSTGQFQVDSTDQVGVKDRSEGASPGHPKGLHSLFTLKLLFMC